MSGINHFVIIIVVLVIIIIILLYIIVIQTKKNTALAVGKTKQISLEEKTLSETIININVVDGRSKDNKINDRKNDNLKNDRNPAIKSDDKTNTTYYKNGKYPTHLNETIINLQKQAEESYQQRAAMIFKKKKKNPITVDDKGKK